MSADVVSGFKPILREVEQGLTLPIPERVRLLRELQCDLEELTDRFVAQGHSVEEALSRAREALVPDQRSLRALHAVHAPLYRRLTGHLAADRLQAVERLALAVTTAAVVALGATVLLRADLLRDPSPFLWPVLALGSLLFAGATAKVFQLWVKGDHNRPGRGLSTLLFLSGMALATGLLGSLFDFYRLAGDLEAAPDIASSVVTAWLVRDAALLSVSILVALAGGLAWFVLAQWVSLVEADHREVLGL